MIRSRTAFSLLVLLTSSFPLAGCHAHTEAPVAPAGGSTAPLRPTPDVAMAAPSDTLRYRVPPCALRYEARATLTVRETAIRGLTPVETWTTFDATPSTTGVTLTANARIFPMNAARVRAYPQDLPPRPPVVIAYGDGTHLSEQSGPSLVYDGIPQHTIGLSVLFPDLPDAAAGSVREWKLDVPSGAPIMARVRLDGWTTISGMRAATLSMEGTQQLASHMVHMTGGPETAQRTVTPGSATMTGRYVVLASGRLLRASVDRAALVATLPPIQRTSSAAPPPAATAAQTEHIEVRLLGACDGPTEPPFESASSPQEAAVVAAGDFIVAWQKQARDSALALVAPELRQREGDDVLWKKLSGFIDREGAQVVAPPRQLGPTDVATDGEAVNVVVRGEPRSNHPAGAPMQMTHFASPTTLKMVRRGGRSVVLEIHAERGAKIGASSNPKDVLFVLR